jgi:hypothetical protein
LPGSDPRRSLAKLSQRLNQRLKPAIPHRRRFTGSPRNRDVF